MPKAFVKSTQTTSYYGSGDVIGKLLLAKGQIKTVPATEATFDAQFVTALTKK
jgi:NitT/TauT family transport system substrate-binding protein